MDGVQGASVVGAARRDASPAAAARERSASADADVPSASDASPSETRSDVASPLDPAPHVLEDPPPQERDERAAGEQDDRDVEPERVERVVADGVPGSDSQERRGFVADERSRDEQAERERNEVGPRQPSHRGGIVTS